MEVLVGKRSELFAWLAGMLVFSPRMPQFFIRQAYI